MGVTRWYFKVQNYFERKYGERTVVLMQVGKFYEVYQFVQTMANETITSDEGQNNLTIKLNCRDKVAETQTITIGHSSDLYETIGHATDVGMILNMKLTSKNKGKPHSLLLKK